MRGFNTVEGGDPKYMNQTKPVLMDEVPGARLIREELAKEIEQKYKEAREKQTFLVQQMGIKEKQPRPPSSGDEFTDYAELEWEEEKKDTKKGEGNEDHLLPFPGQVQIARRSETQTRNVEISTVNTSNMYLGKPRHSSKTHHKQTSVRDKASLYHSEDEEHLYDNEDEDMDCLDDWDFGNESLEDDDYSQEMLMPQAPSLRLSIKTKQTDAETLWELDEDDLYDDDRTLTDNGLVRLAEQIEQEKASRSKDKKKIQFKEQQEEEEIDWTEGEDDDWMFDSVSWTSGQPTKKDESYQMIREPMVSTNQHTMHGQRTKTTASGKHEASCQVSCRTQPNGKRGTKHHTTEDNMMRYMNTRQKKDNKKKIRKEESESMETTNTNPALNMPGKLLWFLGLASSTEEVNLLAESMDSNLGTRILTIFFIILTSIMGHFIQLPVVFMVAICSFLFHYVYIVYGSITDNWKLYQTKKRYNKKMRESKIDFKKWMECHAPHQRSKAMSLIKSVKDWWEPETYDPSREHSYLPPVREMKDLVKPFQGFRASKIKGSERVKTKVRKIKREKAKISEIMVKLVEKRPYIALYMPDRRKRMALYDTGASACTIGQLTLEEIEKTIPVARMVDQHINITGIVPEAATEGTEIVYLSFSCDTGFILKNVPMLVIPKAKGIILGSSLVVAHKWSSYWEGDEFFIEMHKDEKPVRAVFLPDSTASAATISCVSLQPKERTIIPLQIPIIDGLKGTNFHTSDLLATSLDEGGYIRVTPSVTRIKNNSILVEIQNTSEHPISINETMELAKVEIIQEADTKSKLNSNIIDLTEIRQIKHKYDQILVADTDECYCKTVQNPREPVLIQIADKHGLTSTTYNPLDLSGYGSSLPELEPGFTIHSDFDGSHYSKPCVTPRLHLLVVPNQDGTFPDISRQDMEAIKAEVDSTMKRDPHDPDDKQEYYFVDPLLNISLETMEMMVKIHEVFDYRFLPVQHTNAHAKCVHISAQQFPGELLAGTMETRLHFHTNGDNMPEELKQRDKGTPIFKSKIQNAIVSIFRLGIVLNCVVTLGHQYSNSNDTTHLNQAKKTLYIVMNELRTLRVPTEFRITMDIGEISMMGGLMEREIQLRQALIDVCPRFKPFMEPNSKCDILVQNFETENIAEFKGETETNTTIELFKGSISALTNPGPVPRKQKFSQIRAIISNMTAIDEAEFDTPLDPLGLIDEDELYKLMNTHPGCENDSSEGEETIQDEKEIDKTGRPPPIPLTIPKDPPIGIPDTFKPGEWRDYVDPATLPIPPEAQQKFADMMDEHVNLFSCNNNDCRPLIFDGKPAVVSVQLATDKPIYTKPYSINPKMVEVLEKMIDDLLSRDEIVEVTSPYNMPVLLTHHNSSNKHIPFEKRKWRMCLDVRALNSIILHKNLFSNMVKGVECMLPKVQGANWISIVDMRKAYRSLISDYILRMATAFRVPSSSKYPYHVFAYRSTPDGIASLPGTYSYLVQKALSEKSRKHVVQHLDDLLILTTGDEFEHIEVLRSVFTDLLKHNFMVSMPKLKVFQKEVQFLGHMVSGKTISIPEERKSYFDGLQPPTTKKELQSLLGVAGYMATFVDSYHLKTGPLFEALRGKTDKQVFDLNEIQMKSFEELRKAIKDAESLHMVDFNKPIYMEVDASLTGVGSVLYQTDMVGGREVRKIIRYGSKRFTVTEALHHTSLEREAMAILIGAHTHYYYLFNCTEAIIKTDLKSLINLLSCYNNPDSTRMARISHRIYSLPFKWSLQHTAGVSIPLADALSRIPPPYRCAFSDKHLRYPDLKRENIQIPDEWKKTSNLVLTTLDILKAMHEQIVFVEKSSKAVKTKRLKALSEELITLHDELEGDVDQFSNQIQDEIVTMEAAARQEWVEKKEGSTGEDKTQTVEISSLTAVSPKVLLTPQFIAKHQNEDPDFSKTMTQLRIIDKKGIQPKILKKYRLLNDSILVTRKNKNLPFHEPGNIRIMCNDKMALIILSYLHIMGGHYGLNTLVKLFSLTYKTKGNTLALVKIVALGCNACRMHRPVNKKAIPMGRIPIPKAANECWHIDHMVFKKDTRHRGRKISAALNIIDIYSGLLISHLVPDMTVATTIKCFKQIFSTMPAPAKIVMDNASSLGASMELAEYLKTKGIEFVTTITPYNSRGNKCERTNQILRHTMKLVKETFKRSSHFDLYHTVIEMINNRPLSMTTHPHIREAMGDTKEIITPFSLFYGFKPEYQPLLRITDQLNEETREKYIARWQKIMLEHDRKLQQELDDRNKNFKTPEGIQVGDLVLIVNKTAHKESLKYYRNLYEVKKIYRARYMLAPLFGSSTGLVQCNANDIKPYSYSGLFELLPQDIRFLMGESLSPEQLKNMKTSNNKDMPKDFQDWGLLKLPPGMRLRNRLTPASLMSAPALKFSNTNTYSGPSTKSRNSTSSDSQGDNTSSSSSSGGSSSGPPRRPTVRTNPVIRDLSLTRPPVLSMSRLGRPRIDPHTGSVRFERPTQQATEDTGTASDTFTNATDQTKTTGTATHASVSDRRPLVTTPVVRRFPIRRPVPRIQTPSSGRSNNSAKLIRRTRIEQRIPTPFPRVVTQRPPPQQPKQTKLPQPVPVREEEQDKHNDVSLGGIIGGAYGPSPAPTMNSNETNKSEDIFHTAELPDLSPVAEQTHDSGLPAQEPGKSSGTQLPPTAAAPTGKPESDTPSSDISFHPQYTSSPKKKEDGRPKQKDRVPSPKKQAVFADTRALPLVSDNEGGQWRQSRSYVPASGTQEQKGVKHIPFGEASEKSSSSREDQQNKEDSPQFQQLTTTRKGRMVKQPARYGIDNPQHDVNQGQPSQRKMKPGFDMIPRTPPASPPTLPKIRKVKPQEDPFAMSSDDEQMREADEGTDTGMKQETNQRQKPNKSRDTGKSMTHQPPTGVPPVVDTPPLLPSAFGSADLVSQSPIEMTDRPLATPSVARPVAEMTQGFFDPSIAGRRYTSTNPIIHTWTLPEQGSLMPIPVQLPQPEVQTQHASPSLPGGLPAFYPQQMQQQINQPFVGHAPTQVTQAPPVAMVQPQQSKQLWNPSPPGQRRQRPPSARDLPIDQLLNSMDVIRIPRNYIELPDDQNQPTQPVVSPPRTIQQSPQQVVWPVPSGSQMIQMQQPVNQQPMQQVIFNHGSYQRLPMVMVPQQPQQQRFMPQVPQVQYIQQPQLQQFVPMQSVPQPPLPPLANQGIVQGITPRPSRPSSAAARMPTVLEAEMPIDTPVAPVAPPQQPPVRIPVLGKRYPTEPAADGPNILNPRRAVLEPPSHLRRTTPTQDQLPAPGISSGQAQHPIAVDGAINACPQPVRQISQQNRQTGQMQPGLRKRPPIGPVADEPNILNPRRTVAEPKQKSTKTIVSPAPPVQQQQNASQDTPEGNQVPQQQQPQDAQAPSKKENTQKTEDDDLQPAKGTKRPQSPPAPRILNPSRGHASPKPKKPDLNTSTDKRQQPSTSGIPPRRAPPPQFTQEQWEAQQQAWDDLQAVIEAHLGMPEFPGSDNNDNTRPSGAATPTALAPPVMSVTPQPRHTRDHQQQTDDTDGDYSTSTSDDDDHGTATDGNQPPAPLRRSTRLRRQPDRLTYVPQQRQKPKPRKQKSPRNQARGVKRATADANLSRLTNQESESDHQLPGCGNQQSDTELDRLPSGDEQMSPTPVGRPARTRKPPDRLTYDHPAPSRRKKKP